MARQSRAAGPGHNLPPITEEQKAALLVYRTFKIREKRLVAEKAEALAKAARKEVNAEFKHTTADTGYTRYRIEDLLEKQDMDEDEFLADRADVATLYRLGGLPVGAQIELPLGDTADEQSRAIANGKRAYYAMSEPVPPDTVSPILHQAWMQGWQAGQAEVGAQMAMAEEILAARGAPNTDDDDVDLNGEGEGDDEGPEPGSPEAQAAERKAVRRARESLEGLGASTESEAAV